MSYLAKRTLLMVIGLVIIPLTLVLVFVYLEGRNIVSDQIHTMLHLSAQDLEGDLRMIIKLRQEQARDLASRRLIRDLLERIDRARGRPSESKEIARFLDDYVEQRGNSIDEIRVYDKNGRLVFSTQEDPGHPHRLDPQSLVLERLQVSVFEEDERERHRYLRVLTPVKDPRSGVLIGALGIRYKVDPLDSILLGETNRLIHGLAGSPIFGQETRVYIVDSTRTVIAGSVDLLGTKIDIEPVVMGLKVSTDVFGEFTGPFGTQRIGIIAYIEELAWVMVISFSEQEVFAPLDRLATLSFSLLFGGVSLAVIFALVLSRKVATPVVAVAETAGRIADGHWDERVRLSGAKGELALLAISFNKMVETVKSSYDALSTSERKYRSIVETAEEGIWVMDGANTTTFVNPKMAEILGYTVDEMIGKPLFSFLDPEYELVARKNFGEPRAGVAYQRDMRFRRKEGDEVWGRLRTTPLYDNDGRYTGTLTMMTDITERRRVEAELIKLSSAVRESANAVVITDANGVIEYVNPAFKRLTGFSVEEALGKTPRILKSGKHTAAFYGDMWRTILAGEVFRGEFINKRKNGELYYQYETITPIKGRDGKITNFVSAGYDVTDRKKMEDALRFSEAKYRSLVESARDAIFSITPRGTIESLNPAFERLTDWKIDEWLGKSFTDLVHPEDLPQAMDRLDATLKGTTSGLIEVRIRKKSGDYAIGEITVTPQVEEGVVVRVLGIARDVTKRKHLERQLVQAQKMESIGTLASGIAHDFNNVLGIILGHASLIEQSKDDPAVFSAGMENITQAVHRGAALVRQILTFARRGDLSLEPVNVNNSIKEFVGMLKGTFPKTIEIKLRPGSELPIVNIDPGQLHQGLLNLCINARDAMMETRKGKPGGTLSIITALVTGRELKERFADALYEEYVRVTVLDTGPGMSDATLRRIFEPFFTTKGMGKGTGLGLAVVYGIMQNHKGYVDVESAVGVGTSFHLYFPVRAAGNPEVQTLSESDVPGGTETLLIVEDEESLSELLRMILERKGYTVMAAADGIEAVMKYTENKDRIALVLADLGLPILGGAAVFAALKDINPNVAVIIASGYLEPRDRSELFKAGVREFIQKPFVPHEILKKIREVIDMEK